MKNYNHLLFPIFLAQAEIPVHVNSRKLLNLCHENIGSILDVLAPGAGRTV